MIFQDIQAIAQIMHPGFIDVSGLCSWIWIQYNHYTRQFLCLYECKSRKGKELNVRHGSLVSGRANGVAQLVVNFSYFLVNCFFFLRIQTRKGPLVNCC